MAELSFQLDLFSHAGRKPELTCTGCGRGETEAPAYVINDLGRFCLDCEAIAFNWAPEAASSSGGGGTDFPGGPDHSKPWRNPAFDGWAGQPRSKEGGRS